MSLTVLQKTLEKTISYLAFENDKEKQMFHDTANQIDLSDPKNAPIDAQNMDSNTSCFLHDVPLHNQIVQTGEKTVDNKHFNEDYSKNDEEVVAVMDPPSRNRSSHHSISASTSSNEIDNIRSSASGLITKRKHTEIQSASDFCPQRKKKSAPPLSAVTLSRNNHSFNFFESSKLQPLFSFINSPSPKRNSLSLKSLRLVSETSNNLSPEKTNLTSHSQQEKRPETKSSCSLIQTPEIQSGTQQLHYLLSSTKENVSESEHALSSDSVRYLAESKSSLSVQQNRQKSKSNNSKTQRKEEIVEKFKKGKNHTRKHPTLLELFGSSKEYPIPHKQRPPMIARKIVLKRQHAVRKSQHPPHPQQRDLSFFIKGVKPTPLPSLHATDSVDVECIRIPKPIPLSWSTPVLPYSSNFPNQERSHYFEFTLDKINWQLLESLGPFYAILMDPPLATSMSKQSVPKGYIVLDDLWQWVKLSSRLIPKGFLFIWIEKEYIAKFVLMAKKWKFHYVENLVWIKRNVNNKFHRESYIFFAKSKLTLLILRKGGEMELRHQRNSDVVEFFVHRSKDDVDGCRECKPNEYVYRVIETLLPEANYNKQTKRGHFLELWAERNSGRRGWTHVFVVPSDRTALSVSEVSLSESSEWLCKFPKASQHNHKANLRSSSTIDTPHSLSKECVNETEEKESAESDADSEAFEMMESQHMRQMTQHKQPQAHSVSTTHFQLYQSDEDDDLLNKQSELRQFWGDDF